MTRHSILEYAAVLQPHYLNARKSEKSAILNEFCQTIGYRRKAAIRLLPRKHPPRNPRRRGRPRQDALRSIRGRNSRPRREHEDSLHTAVQLVILWQA
jgi:hypothetical protein